MSVTVIALIIVVVVILLVAIVIISTLTLIFVAYVKKKQITDSHEYDDVATFSTPATNLSLRQPGVEFHLRDNISYEKAQSMPNPPTISVHSHSLAAEQTEAVIYEELGMNQVL